MAIGTRRRGGNDAVSLECAVFRQHTLTDPLPGYEPYADISVLNPELLARGGRLQLQRIDSPGAQPTIPS